MESEKKSSKWLLVCVLLAAVVLFFVFTFFPIENLGLLNPKGIIALKERNLMIMAVLIMLIIVIPVFVLTFFIVWRYRADKKGDAATYDPNWDHSVAIEAVWWGIPLAIILALSVITWKSSHELSPYKSLASAAKPIEIDVVALDWKWLFIYPQLGIATVNYVEFPAGTSVDFHLTSDAPMNSFWIPQLGSQMYAMAGMSTDLHLEAFKPGVYNGLSANISGQGFAGMKFTAHSVSQQDFASWVASIKQSSLPLDAGEFSKLSLPSENNAAVLYSSVDANLYNNEVMKFMSPATSTEENQANGTMNGMMMGN